MKELFALAQREMSSIESSVSTIKYKFKIQIDVRKGDGANGEWEVCGSGEYNIYYYAYEVAHVYQKFET